MDINKIKKWEKEKELRQNKYIVLKKHDLRKAVYRLDKNTEEILDEYDSLRIAKEIFGDTVGKCVLGVSKTAGGYKWIKKEDEKIEKIKEWENIKQEKLLMIF